MSSSSRRWLCFALVATSGAAALAHELLWTRALLDVLGSSASASARVLGAFFLGLSLGAAGAGRFVSRIQRPWLALAGAELLIAALSLPAITLAGWSEWLWPAVGVDGIRSGLGEWVKLAVSAGVVVPPAMAMGATLPLAIAALGRERTDPGRDGLWLYSTNTAGAVLGLLALSAWLLHALGMRGSMLLAMGLNLIAGTTALVLHRASRTAIAPPATDEVPGATARLQSLPPRTLYALAFVSGAGVLATEVVAVHLLMLVTTMSFAAPTAILAAVIALLAAAAAMTPFALRRLGLPRLLVSALAVGGALLATAPLAYWALVQNGTGLQTATGLPSFILGIIGLTMAVIGPSALAIGLVFPALIRGLGTRDARETSRRVGRLLAVNGVGGLLGAELAQLVLLPAFGPYVALAAVGALYALAGLAVAVRAGGGARTAALPIACSAAVLALAATALPGLPTVNEHMGFEVIEVRSGRHGTLAVVEQGDMGRAMVVNNQYVLGSTAAAADQARQTHLPLLLHPAPSSVALIGLATGVSAGAALDHSTVEQVEVLELSEAVIEAARRHFADDNGGIVDAKRATVIEEDGRTYIRAAKDRFDVIVGDLFLPWSSGVGRLYSVEHFRAVENALTDGGVFCQWLPMHQLTPDQVDMVLASITRVFPEVHLFRNSYHPDKPSMGIVALKNRALSWPVVSDRADAGRDNGELRDPTMRHGVAVAMLYIERVTAEDYRDIPTNTLANLALELDAGSHRVSTRAEATYLRGQRFVDYLLERVRHGLDDDTVPRDVRRLARLGFDLTNWEIASRIGHDEAERLGDNVRRRMPTPLRTDDRADWSLWPGLRGGTSGRPL